METNAHLGWVPEEKTFFSSPAEQQPTGEIENTTPHDEKIIPGNEAVISEEVIAEKQNPEKDNIAKPAGRNATVVH